MSLSAKLDLAHLEVNWRAWWPERFAQLRSQMLARVDSAVIAWSLERLELMHGGDIAIVCAARRDDRDVVLKVNPELPEETGVRDEARGLAAWARSGAAVELLAQRDEGLTLLLERLRPATSLGLAVADPCERLRVLGTLARELHKVPPPAEICHLRDSSEARDWLERLARDPEAKECAELLADERVALLHTDLHIDNTLYDGARWRVIDPKPHLGPPEADVFGLLSLGVDLPDDSSAQALVLEWTRVYADAAAMNLELLRRWARIRALASARRAEALGDSWAGYLRALVAALATRR